MSQRVKREWELVFEEFPHIRHSAIDIPFQAGPKSASLSTCNRSPSHHEWPMNAARILTCTSITLENEISRAGVEVSKVQFCMQCGYAGGFPIWLRLAAGKTQFPKEFSAKNPQCSAVYFFDAWFFPLQTRYHNVFSYLSWGFWQGSFGYLSEQRSFQIIRSCLALNNIAKHLAAPFE